MDKICSYLSYFCSVTQIHPVDVLCHQNLFLSQLFLSCHTVPPSQLAMPPESILISVIFSLLHRSAQSTSYAKMQRLHSTFWLSEPLFKVVSGEKQHKRYKWNAGRKRVKGVSLNMDLSTGAHSGKTLTVTSVLGKSKKRPKNSNIQQPQTLGKSKKRPKKNSNIQQPQTNTG